MLDELTPEVIFVAGGAAVLVLGVMAIVWMVSTREEGSPKRPVAPENAPPVAKPSKKRKPFSPRKKRDVHRDANSTDEEKDEEDDQPARKSILKTPAESQRDEPVAPNNKSASHHVEFKMEDSPPRDERSSRPNPPTPHPSSKPPMLGMDTEQAKPASQPVTKSTETTTTTKERKSGGSPPSKAPSSQTKATQKQQQQQTTTPPSSSGHKKKPKPKQLSASFDSSSDELPVSRIAAILIASPLSDEDVELLMRKLLEKQESNVEWEAASRSGSSDSVKSLRKANEELQRRCADAEQASQTYSARIKEMRAEIQQEKSRHVATENSLQAKLTKQNEDIVILKGQVERFKEEVKTLKASEAAELTKKLESENTNLKAQLSLLAEEKAVMNTKISSHEKQVLSGQETIKDLRSELRRAKDALKTTNTDPHQVEDLQTALAQAQQEKDKILVELKAVNEERGKMRGEMRLLEDAHQEEKKKLEQELSERVVAPVVTEQPVAAAGASQEDIDQLKAELAKVKEEGDQQQVQHAKEVETLKATCNRDAEQLRMAKSDQDTLRGTVQELEQKNTANDNELKEMRGKLEKLANLEEELKTAKEALLAEQASKKDLQSQTGVLSNGTAETEDSQEKLSADLSKAQEEKQELEDKVKAMQEKLDELKTKNTTLRDSLWKARDDAAATEKNSAELVKEANKGTKQRVTAARDEAIAEQQQCHKEFLKRLFPSVEVGEEEDWLSVFEVKVSEEGRRKEQELAEVRSREEEFSQNAENLRTALLSTKGKLDMLQNKCVEREEKLMEQLQEAVAAKQEMERKLVKETEALNETRGKLEAVNEQQQQQAATAEETDRLAAKNKEQEEELLELRAKLAELEDKVVSPTANSTAQLEEELAQLRAKLADSDSQNEALKSANLDLNTRLGSLSPVASTSSEV